jgi:hypothetical protein
VHYRRPTIGILNRSSQADWKSDGESIVMNIIGVELNFTLMVFYDAVTDRQIDGISFIFTFGDR